jgi:transposase-like protein
MSLPPEASPGLFNGRHFNHEIITLCVRWYVTYKLSYRDLVEMMAERNVDVVHTTIMRCCDPFPRNGEEPGMRGLD